MYSVLIVEDEVLVNAGLKSLIQTTYPALNVIGEAHNGQEGLNIYHNKRPDIILTDIRMPIMDGIEMIKQIRKKDKDTKIVVLSCYDDFELVRQCFRLGISDYIPKTKISLGEADTVLSRLYQELEEKQNNGPDRMDDKNGFSVCQEYILRQSLSKDRFIHSIRDYHIDEHRLCIISLMFSQNAGGSNKSEKKQHHQIILSLLQELLNQEGRGIVITDYEERFIIITNAEECDADPLVQTGTLMQDIRMMLRKYINASCVFGVSSFSDDFDSLPLQYDEAVYAMEEALFWERPYGQYGKKSLTGNGSEKLIELKEYIERSQWLTDLCKKKIGDDIQTVYKSLNTRESMKEAFVRWINWIIYDSMLQADSLGDSSTKAINRVLSAATLCECAESYYDFMNNVAAGSNDVLVHKEVAKAVSYIRRNYSEEEISLPTVAEAVGLNKDYLGSLFRKEIGMGYSDYVNNLRVQKACELLENTNMSVAEIAWKVGITDESYFSRVFKKITGLSPKEYKRYDKLTDEDPKRVSPR